jgi:hypothetical protein
MKSEALTGFHRDFHFKREDIERKHGITLIKTP